MNRLKDLRKKNDIPIQSVADYTGISKSMLFRYERETHLPTIYTAMRIADFFSLSIYDIWKLPEEELKGGDKLTNKNPAL